MRDTLAFLFLGWRGPLGKWAADHWVTVVLRPYEGAAW